MSEPPASVLNPDTVAETGVDSNIVLALAMQRRWLSALLADPNNLLLQYDPALAVVLTPQGEQLALLTHDEPERVGKRIDAALASGEAGAIQAVVFGGGPELVVLLEQKRDLGKRASFAHVTLDGELAQVTGKTPAALQAAREQLSAHAPLSDAAIGEALARGQPLRRDAASFAAAVARGVPVVTTTIAVVCSVLFALGYYWSGNQGMAANWRMGANHGELVRAGEWWRVLASAFLHGSILHVFVNMLALMSLGRMLERILGVPRYLALYGLSALGGGLASALLTPNGSVGASGAIWGLLGAALALTFFPRGLLPELARAQMKKRAFSTLAINVLISFAPGIDRYAHFGGGLVGGLLVASGAITLGVPPLWARDGKRRGDVPWTLVGAALSVAMVASVAMALAQGKPWELRGPLAFHRVSQGDSGISLELPALEAKPGTSQPDGLRSFVYGEPPGDPVVVEVFVNDLGGSPGPEQLRGLLGEMAVVAETAPEGFRLVGKPERLELGALSYVRARYQVTQNTDVTMETWYTVLENREVRIDVLALPSRNDRWQGFERRVAGSVRLDRGP